MAKKEFRVPFQFCRLDRAVRLLNQFTDCQIEVDDVLNFAMSRNIQLHVFYDSVTASNFHISHENLRRMKEFFKFNSYGSHTYFRFGYSFEERILALDSLVLEETSWESEELSEKNVPAFVKGFWAINEWDLRTIYFGEAKVSLTQLYALGGLLMRELSETYIRIEYSLGIEQIIIFESEIVKVYEHLTGKKVFVTSEAADDQFKVEREAKEFESEPRINERVTGTVAELIYGLLQLVYKYDDPILNQSTRLYADLQKKFLKHEPSIDANIMSQRAFEELMQKVQIQRDKLRG